MVISIYSFGFLVAFIITKSYRYFGRYYSSVHYVACLSILYTLVCRGYPLWSFRPWWIVTDKVSQLIQFAILFPCTTVLFLRYIPRHTRHRILHFLGFSGLYVLLEWLLVNRHEIIYSHGWNFSWSVVIDILLFTLTWIHMKSWKIAVLMSVCIVLFLIMWFRVPLSG